MKGKFWHEGLQFECQRCGYCCTFEGGAVFATEEEFHRIATLLSLPFEEFLEKYTYRAGEKVSLRSRADGPCIFYDNGCTIYPVRPTQCRTFPFWPEIIKSRQRWESQGLSCEGINQGKKWTREEIREQLNLSKKPLLKISEPIEEKK